MEKVPGIVKFGGALGFFGGFVSMVCLVLFFDAEEDALAAMGAYLLIAVMFFALAGGFAKGGMWTWNVLLLMTFLTVGTVCCTLVIGVADIYAGVALVLIGVVIAVTLSLRPSKDWANRTRF